MNFKLLLLLLPLFCLNIYSADNSIIGKNFLKLFNIQIDLEKKYFADEILRKDKIYILYTNNPLFGSSAIIRFDDIGYNLFYFKLEDDAQTIKQVSRIDLAKDA